MTFDTALYFGLDSIPIISKIGIKCELLHSFQWVSVALLDRIEAGGSV